MNPRRILAFLIVLASTPFASAAGCRAHYTARVSGNVVADHTKHAGQTIRLIYRAHRGDESCERDWNACLLEVSAWAPLRGCEETETRPPARFTVVADSVSAIRFDHCTHMVGIDYRADIVAFVDRNDDGRINIGEPYGVHVGLTRDGEPKSLPLSIAITQVVGPPTR